MAQNWKTYRAKAVAKFAFEPTGKFQMALAPGDKLDIYAESAGWFKGVKVPEKTKGIFPAGYVEITEERSTAAKAQETEEDSDKHIVSEVQSRLKEWARQCRTHMQAGDLDAVHLLKQRMATIADWRRQFMDADTPDEARSEVRRSILKLLEGNRRMVQGYSVAKTGSGEDATEENTSIVELHKLHSDMQQRLAEGAALPRNATQQREMERKGALPAHRVGRTIDAAAAAAATAASGGTGSGAASGAAGSATADAAAAAAAAAGNGSSGSGGGGGGPPGSRQSTHITRRVAGSVVAPGGGSGGGMAAAAALSGVSAEEAAAMAERLLLVVEYKIAMAEIGEPLVLYFTLLSADEKRYISEDFVLRVTANGLPEQLEVMEQLKAVFRVTRRQLMSNLYVAVRVFRMGGLGLEDSKKKKKSGMAMYRRPYGVAMLPVTPNVPQLSAETPWENSQPLYTHKSSSDAEALFNSLPGLLLMKRMDGIEVAHGSRGVALALSLYSDPTEPGQPPQLPPPIAALTVVPSPRWQGLQHPSVVRNDLNVLLHRCTVSQDKKRTAKNVLVRILAVMDGGGMISCLTPGRGPQCATSGRFESAVYYHNNSPEWDENIRVAIPSMKNAFEKLHLLFILSHASTNVSKTHAFAFGYLRLTGENKNAIANGTHTIRCYASLPDMDGGGSGAAPSTAYLSGAGLTERRDTITVTTTLASNVKTQDEGLHNLFSWRAFSGDTAHIRVLEGVGALGLRSVERYLRRILDALFDMAAVVRKDAVLRVVFRVLVHVLSMAAKSGTGLAQAVTDYIDTVFSGAGVHHMILRCLKYLFQCTHNPAQPTAADGGDGNDDTASTSTKRTGLAAVGFGGGGTTDTAVLSKAVNCLPALLQVAVRSWSLQAEAEAAAGGSGEAGAEGKAFSPMSLGSQIGGSAIAAATTTGGDGDDGSGEGDAATTFQQEVLAVLYHLDGVMSLQEAWLSPIRTATLKSVFQAFTALQTVYLPGDLGDIVRGFLESVPTSGVKQNCAKLNLIRDVTQHPLFAKQSARDKLMPVVIRTLQAHIRATDDERLLCIAILKRLLHVIQQAANVDDIWRLSIVMPELAQTVLELLKKRSAADATRNRLQSGLGMSASQLTAMAQLQAVPRAVRESVDEGPDSAVCLLGILHLLSPDQMDYFLSALMPEPEQQRVFLALLTEVCAALITPPGGAPVFAPTWLVLNMFQATTVLKCLTWVSRSLLSSRLALTGWGVADDALPALTNATDGDGGDGSDRATVSAVVAAAIDAGALEGAAATDGSSSSGGSDGSSGSGGGDTSSLLLWRQFLTTLFALHTCPALDLEGCSAARRDYVMAHYGDRREAVATLLHDCWSALGPRQLLFVTRDAVAWMLLRTAAPYAAGAAVGGALYLDCVREEFAASGAFSRIERHTVDTVDQVVNDTKQRSTDAAAAAAAAADGAGGETKASGGGDAAAAAEGGDSSSSRLMSFLNSLEESFAADEVLTGGAALEFLTNIRRMFTRLSELAALPKTPVFEDERASAMIGLLGYLRATRRDDMFVKYVWKLRTMQLGLGLNAEAANTVLMMADYEWSSEPVQSYAKAGYPMESSQARTHRVYGEAMQLLDKAELWEAAIELGRKLRAFNEQQWALEAVVAGLRQEAALMEKVVANERFPAVYFRVTFFGTGFPSEYRNVTYVYRGAPLESIMDFSGRIGRKFPGATTVAPGKEKDEYATDESQRLQISKVTPAFECEMEGEPHRFPPAMPARSVSFHANNNRRIFFFSRPFRKRKEKSSNEFLDCWVNNTFLLVPLPFPTTHRRQLVTRRHELVLNPLETAVVTMRDKNVELKNKIDEMDVLTQRTTDQSFTMMMNGVVDAAVAGGVKNYETFLTGEYREANPDIATDIDAHPEKADKVAELQQELELQLVILKRGMAVHGRVCSEGMKPLHEFLMGRFVEMLALMATLGVACPTFNYTPPAAGATPSP